MELKNYQKKVMSDLNSYMECLSRSENLISAWREYWFRQDINVGFGGVPSYNNSIPKVPHICMKVPTGGGKTFMACAAIKHIYDAMPLEKDKVVVWLVPSDSILKQTIKNLSDPTHPYRQRLDMDFSGRISVYTKDQLLNGQNFSPDTVREMLTVCILSYSSLRINSNIKDVRKVYQENGNLLRFADFFQNKNVLLADTPDTALIQVLRQLAPVVIVDESHNAESELSVEMLKNLNPAFILDLTATPRKNSNILSYVDARELKKENMVKLPVIVFNRNSVQNVIQDAIQLRGSIEKQAQSEENYIRPIVLFQAQPNIKGKENETFDKIKEKLVEIGIPEDEIAIKTSNCDEIGNIDLMSNDCKIRYIITVNALKEGWDCPFAYILASLANKTSKIDVEQIVGRILRQPYAQKHRQPLLNSSYVLTCSNDFHETLDSVITGLNQAGFSKRDYRIGNEDQIETTTFQQSALSSVPNDTTNIGMEDFENISTSDIKSQLENQTTDTNQDIKEMIKQAENQTAEYDQEAKRNDISGFLGGELGNMLIQNTIQPEFKKEIESLYLPQFFIETTPDIFGKDSELLEKENLSKGFSLSGQDANIKFELSTGEMYQVDIKEHGDTIPQYIKTSKQVSDYIRDYIKTLPEEKRKITCANSISQLINRNNRYATKEVSAYVQRVIDNMSNDSLTAMETSLPVYAKKIQEKIELQENMYREQQFNMWMDNGRIKCKENYKFPDIITPSDTIDSIKKSLYTAESNNMNGFERKVLDDVVALDNVQWWHRIIENKGFRINGYINHYPDFIVKTKSGKYILIEVKGDYLDGDDSRSKLRLGRKWQSMAGNNFRYFMVFDNKDLHIDGAYSIDNFISMFKDL